MKDFSLLWQSVGQPSFSPTPHILNLQSSHQILCVLRKFSRPLFTSPYSPCASLRRVQHFYYNQLFWHFTLDLYQGFQQFTKNLDESAVCSKPEGSTLGVRASTTAQRKCPQRALTWHFWICVTPKQLLHSNLASLLLSMKFKLKDGLFDKMEKIRHTCKL